MSPTHVTITHQSRDFDPKQFERYPSSILHSTRSSASPTMATTIAMALTLPPPPSLELARDLRWRNPLRIHPLRLRPLQALRRGESSPLPPTLRALGGSSAAAPSEAVAEGEEKEEEETFTLLASITSRYNEITIVDSPKSRLLLLDNSGKNPLR